jgi:hypothetical protein
MKDRVSGKEAKDKNDKKEMVQRVEVDKMTKVAKAKHQAKKEAEAEKAKKQAKAEKTTKTAARAKREAAKEKERRICERAARRSTRCSTSAPFCASAARCVWSQTLLRASRAFAQVHSDPGERAEYSVHCAISCEQARQEQDPVKQPGNNKCNEKQNNPGTKRLRRSRKP